MRLFKIILLDVSASSQNSLLDKWSFFYRFVILTPNRERSHSIRKGE
jgi:hypothetical protein